MVMLSNQSFSAAREDFRQARQQAAMQDLMARLTGRSIDLLSFEEVRRKLRASSMSERGLQEVPVAAIIGTTGRYTEFTRTFMPREGVDESRWSRVNLAAKDLAASLPPIEVYKIGEAYFVKDGHHRVSVAVQQGVPTLAAYVTEVQTQVPLGPEVQPADLIVKAEYAEFLEATGLAALRPGMDLSLSEAGGYAKLQEHIELFRFSQAAETGQPLSAAEAVTRWYDEEYWPVAALIRERGMLRDFPGRTEADLYLWAAENRAELRAALGWNVKTEAVAADLAETFKPSHHSLAGRLLRVVAPALADGPQPGAWRQERLEERYLGRLFNDLLVPVSGEPESWAALDQALEVASREGARLLGLHLTPTEAARQSEAALLVKARFDARCQALAFPGVLAVETGEIAERICARAALADLVVLHIAHPPSAQVLERLGSGLSTIIRRCPRPILAVPGPVTPLTHLLLAFDGSPKAKEALFVAAYMAAEWHAALTVLTVREAAQPAAAEAAQATAAAAAQAFAREYLEFHEVTAEYQQVTGAVPEAILGAAAATASDLILMGGYGARPLVEVVLGSVVDQVLRATTLPLLICR